MDKNTIRVAEACEWIRTPSGLLRIRTPSVKLDKNTIRVAEACEWIRTPSGLLRPVNG